MQFLGLLKRARVRRSLGASVCLLVGMVGTVAAQLSTLEHVAQPGFWPTKINKSATDFVGVGVCAKCHAEVAATQKTTSMARSAAHIADDDFLRTHPHLSFQEGRYKYEIDTSVAGSVYTAKDGTHSLSAPLTWGFGAGTVGQSYLYSQDGRWYEARVSFFGSIDNLAFTPGRALASPRDLEEAMSRPVGNQEIMRCFKCHGTGVTSEYSLESSKTLFLGISCEACHGPGKKHADANTADLALNGGVNEEAGDKLIFNPGRLSPADSVDFCGACHSTWWDVRLSSAEGHATVVSPVYRLESSKCWGKGDARLTCITCHDPHQRIDRQSEHYDLKCLACHVSAAGASTTADHPGPGCPVAKTKCTSCHMPKMDVPELHYAVADHEIRVVRATAEHDAGSNRSTTIEKPGGPSHP